MTGRIGRALAAARGARGRQRGSAIVELVVLTVILLIPVVYLMVTALDMQRGAYAVSAAARAGARAFNTSGGNAGVTQQAIDLALSDQDALAWKDGVSVHCNPACLQPGSFTTVTVTVQVPLPFIPDFVGRATSIHFHSSHASPYGQYKPAG